MAASDFASTFLECWNRHDLAILDLYHEQAMLRDSGQASRDLHGKADLEAFYSDQWAGTPRSFMSFHETITEGNVIFVEWEWWPLGEGTEFSARGVSIWTLDEGTIRRDVTYFDPTQTREEELPWKGFTGEPSPSSSAHEVLLDTSVSTADLRQPEPTTADSSFATDFFELWNAHAIDRISSLYASDAVMVDSGLFMGELQGRDAIREYYTHQWRNSPESSIGALNVANTVNRIYVEWSWRPLGAANELEARGVSVWTIQEGRIAHDLTYWDPTGLRLSEATWKGLDSDAVG